MGTSVPTPDMSLNTAIIFLDGVYSRGDIPSEMFQDFLHADTKQRVKVKIDEKIK
jgi:hypothetical protein